MTTVTLSTTPQIALKWWQPAWNFLRPELLPLFRALTEIALIAPLAIRFMPWTRFWPTAFLSLWLFLLMLVPHYLNRFLSQLKLSPGRRRLVIIAGALVAVVLNVRLLLYDPPQAFSFSWLSEIYLRLVETDNPAIQQDISVVIFTGLAWWRGMTLTGRGWDSQRTGRNFRIAIIAILPVIIFISGDPLRMVVTPFVLLFFVGSLMTLALTRAQQVETGESGSAFPVTPGWVVRVLGPIIGLALITGVFTGLLTGRQIAGLLGWLSPLWLAVSATANTVIALLFKAASPIFAFVEWLFTWLQGLFSDMPLVTPTPAATPEDGAIQPTPVPESEFIPAFDLATTELILQIAGILLVVIALGILFYISYRSQRRMEIEREAILGARQQAAQPSSDKRRGGASLLDNVRRWRKLRTAASIRRIYENMLIIAAQNGFPRSAVETPIEYTTTLQQVWPAQHPEIDLITEAYVRVRYGELPETKAEFDAIRSAWEVLRQTPPVRREGDDGGEAG